MVSVDLSLNGKMPFLKVLANISSDFVSERSRSGTITVSEIYITSPNYVNRASDTEESGVFPAGIAPPPYTGNSTNL